jgi:aminopeptidase
MSDIRTEKLAELLVGYSVAVRPGDRVVIRGDVVGAPLMDALYKRILQAGGHPFLVPALPEQEELFYRYASDEQLGYIHSPIRMIYETYDVIISIMAEANTKALSRIDPQKMVLHQRAYTELSKKFLERAAKKELRWAVTLFPTEGYAQEADMCLSDYEDFVYQACMPDVEDPVRYWTKVSQEHGRVIQWLHGKKDVHIIGPETDLKLSIEGRPFINCDCHLNIPDGEIFTGPVEDSVEGHVAFSYPAIFQGREVSGIHLWFEKGKVVKATADKNEEYLLKTIDTDAGARYVGEFAIGTNKGIQQFTRQILFDEKISGSFHMALGSGYPESGSKNESAIHWDMICDLRQGGEIRVDGELLYKNGEFKIL